MFTVYNSSIQGQPLVAATNGNDIRALEFSAVLKQIPPLPIAVATLIPLSASELVQASVGHLLLKGTSSGDRNVTLGPDTATQANYLISLFDLKTTSDIRILDFVLASDNDSQSAINLKNTSMTSANVQIDYYASISNSQILFGNNAKAGQQRFVSVQKVSDGVIKFTVLRGCCSDLSIPR